MSRRRGTAANPVAASHSSLLAVACVLRRYVRVEYANYVESALIGKHKRRDEFNDTVPTQAYA